jgi:hypothetical protein
MGLRRTLSAVLPLLALLACGGHGTNEGFKVIRVDDLAGMLGSPGHATIVLDANKDDFRAREGIIPGAILLSSYQGYDVAKELPPDKGAPLVFYCADSH